MTLSSKVTIVEINDQVARSTSDFLREIFEVELKFPAKPRPDIDDPLNAYSIDRCSLKVALMDDEVVGSCGLIGKENDNGYLKRMYVSKNVRGLGVGAKILDAVLDQARAFNMKCLYLGIDPMTPVADTFYSQHGFEFILRPDVPEDIPTDGDTRWMYLRL